MEIHRTKFSYRHNRRATASNWINLPYDLLSTITHRLTNINDYIRFSAVCQLWHAFNVQDSPSYLSRHRHVPVLILTANNNPYANSSLPFYSLIEDRLCETVGSPHCSDFKGCLGVRSTLGWLVKASVHSHVHLFNPFLVTDNVISLPQLTTDIIGNASYLRKVAVSANPSSSSDYIVMAIYEYGHQVGFIRPGDQGWTEMKVDDMLCMDDVIYRRDGFYLVDSHGQVYSTDLSSRKVSPVGVPPDSIRLNLVTDSNYLVESSGDLLLIKREREYIDLDVFSYSTSRFVVLKLDCVENKWIELENFSGDSVFIGDNSSFALSASDFPGCKPNCIYFTDDYYAGYSNIDQRGLQHDMGVFNMEKGITERGYPVDSDDVMDPPPIWLEPTLSASRKFNFDRKLEWL